MVAPYTITMYADRVVSGSKRSVKDRLHGNTVDDFRSTKQTIGSKRQRQNDDKWKHDLYDNNKDSQVSSPNVGGRDLRLNLEKKGRTRLYQSVKGSSTRDAPDLREKLSGSMHVQPVNDDTPQLKEVVVARPAKKSAPVEVPTPETKKPINTASRKKSQQKAESSVDTLLQSLGLEKYSITFQAEEIDMTALMHMNDDDLKALSIPMGPRKKILLALDSRV